MVLVSRYDQIVFMFFAIFDNFIAQFCEQADDFPLIGWKDLDRHVLIEIDTANGLSPDNESALNHLLDARDLQRVFDRTARLRAAAGRTGRR